MNSDDVPVVLYVPNLIGYIRWILMFRYMNRPKSRVGRYSFATSLFLDILDGPIARRLDMTSEFGDFNDHLCDHLSMMVGVYNTSDMKRSRIGRMNVAVNAAHCAVALMYMARKGRYFKHGVSGL
jgi:phosphatidylserine synthase